VSECIIAPGATHRGGYKRKMRNGVSKYAHRWAWEDAYGPIPEGLVIMHLCDIPACINIEHLSIGTNKDNVTDMYAKGRAFSQTRTHCKQGHEMTDENTYVSKPGRRSCVICRREACRRWEAKRERA
jgi:hypothetical protein